MVKAFNQKASKRVTCHKKYKIRKKVREHNKKLARTLKDSNGKKKKIAAKVPNLAPFKEDLLLEAIAQTQAKNDLKKARKGTKMPLLVTKPEVVKPKAMAKSVSAHVTISQCDILLWVIDVRSVDECLCEEISNTIKEANKNIIFLLNKIDLVPFSVVRKWHTVLSKTAPTFLMKSTQIILTECEQIVPALKQILGRFGGAKSILSYLNRTYKEVTKIGVIGTKQVGKTCVVSSLLKSCGRTKAKRSIDTKLSESIRLTTTPGLIESESGGLLHVMDNCSKYMNYSPEVLSALSKNIRKEDAMFHFTLPEYSHPEGFLDALAIRYNQYYLKTPDHSAVGRLILKQLRDTRLKFYVESPAVSELATIPADVMVDVERFLFKGDALKITGSQLDIVIVKKEKKKRGGEMDIEEGDEEDLEEMGSGDESALSDEGAMSEEEMS